MTHFATTSRTHEQHTMPQQLTIVSKPFKSSKLSIPPSPFSPKLPITPPASPPKKSAELVKPRLKPEISSPPSEPLNWLWECHICNRVYQLGVTRRCLDDGHFFCAGTTTVKRSKRTGYKKTIRHKACASEFDYQGWKAWGSWRRDVAQQLEAAEALEHLLNDEPKPLEPLFTPTLPDEGRWPNGTWTKKPLTKNAAKDFWSKDCWSTCDYPSECRWGKQFGVHTPVIASTPSTVTVPSSPESPPPPEAEQKSKTSFDDILLDVPSITDPTSEDFLEPLTQMSPNSPEDGIKKPSMDDLLESAKRRKRRSAGALPSPLASNQPSPTTPVSSPSTAQVLQRAFDDFDLDFRKSFGKAGDAVTSFVTSVRNSTALEDEKAEAFVTGSKGNKKRFSAGLW